MTDSASPRADIGVIGLAVMGQNLVLNMEDHGYTVAVYNRSPERVQTFTGGLAAGRAIMPAYTLADLAASLKRPRRVMLMVKAGPAVDDTMAQLIPALDPGDIIIDGGNSHYEDTIRRAAAIEAKGLRYVGTGVSGGEEGARTGPSIMPGGSPAAWPHLREIFTSIAANVDGLPCCDWVGPSGAGHFVKMVHNGIEYGDMQVIAEAYLILKNLMRFTNDQMSRVFDRWNRGKLDSYLIAITRDILAYRNPAGESELDFISDSAGQKGTGKWTAAAALEAGIPLTLIGEAVHARFLSSLTDQRQVAAARLPAPDLAADDFSGLVRDLEEAVYAAKIVSYAQGFMLLRAAAARYQWPLDYGSIALMWRGGCIIRSVFLDRIKEAYDARPDLSNLLLDPYFAQAMTASQAAWRRVVVQGVQHGIPMPALSSALAFFDGYRQARGGANLIQAQRDYFGAHTYERTDRDAGEFFHTDWTGTGGDVTAGSYDA